MWSLTSGRQALSGLGPGHVTFLNFGNKMIWYIGNGARERHGYNGRLIGNHIWPIKWHDCQWPITTATGSARNRAQNPSNCAHVALSQHLPSFLLFNQCRDVKVIGLYINSELNADFASSFIYLAFAYKKAEVKKYCCNEWASSNYKADRQLIPSCSPPADQQSRFWLAQ